MRHVQSVFYTSPSAPGTSRILPLTELDVPQQILVSFGKSILWAWTQWNGGTVVGIESVLIWVCDFRPPQL